MRQLTLGLSLKNFTDVYIYIFAIWLYVRNSCTPSPLRYALTKNPVGSGTTM
jgi:hypothetical protein